MKRNSSNSLEVKCSCWSNIMLRSCIFEVLRLWDSGSLNIVMTSNSCNLSMIQRVKDSVWESVIERQFASWWLAYILLDLRYIQGFPEVMTSCPRVYTYPPLYSSIECYQVCSSRHSLVWMVRLHSGRWGDSGAVHALYRGRNCGRGGSNVILNGIISRTRSLARSPSAIQWLFDFGVLGFSFSYWTCPPGDPVVPTLFSLSLFVCHMFWVMLFWCEFFYITPAAEIF